MNFKSFKEIINLYKLPGVIKEFKKPEGYSKGNEGESGNVKSPAGTN